MTTWKVSGWPISLSAGAVSIVVTATRTTGVAATSLVIILPVTGTTVAAAITAAAIAAAITTAAIAAAAITAAAAAAVAATATVAATSSAPTVAAATASSVTAIARFLLGVVHPDLPTVDGLAVQCIHRTIGIFWVLEGDEAEAAGRHGALIFDHSSIDNLAVLGEHRLQGLLICIEA